MKVSRIDVFRLDIPLEELRVLTRFLRRHLGTKTVPEVQRA